MNRKACDRHKVPFYDRVVYTHQEQELIERVLEKFRTHPADEALQQAIYEELTRLRHQGEIHSPFQVVLCEDPMGRYPPRVDVILDTKV